MALAINKKGAAALAACACLWSTGGLFIKLLDWSPMAICGMRGLIAAAIIFVSLKKFGFGAPVINRHTLVTGMFLGLTCMLFVVANKLTTAANAIMLQSANPIFVIMYSLLIKRERVSRRDIVVSAVVLCGVVLFFIDELSPGGMLGNMLALLSAVTFAMAFVWSCGASSLKETMSGVLAGHFLCFIVSLPFMFFAPPKIDAVSLGAIAFLGVFQLGIPYVLFSIGANTCPPLAVSLIGMLEPVFNPVWVALFLHEIPGLPAICGSCLVLITLAWWCVGNAKSPAGEKA